MVLMVALAGAPVSGSENRVSDNNDGCGDLPRDSEDYKKCKAGSNKAGPEAVSDWIAQNRIQGLDPDHWAAGPIMDLALAGMLQVSVGETVRPDAPATLWQAARIMMVWTEHPVAGLAPGEIAARAAELGLIPGPAPAEDRPVTRLEAAYMAARLTDFPGTVEHQTDMAGVFADWSAIPEASRDQVYWVSIHNRLFVGYPDRTFRPAEPFTLGQFAVVMQRLAAFWSSGPAPVLQGP